MALTLPRYGLPVDVDTARKRDPPPAPASPVPALLHAHPLTPHALDFVQADVQHAPTLDAAVDALFPRPLPLPTPQTRAHVSVSQRVSTRLADAAVLVTAQIIPFLPEARAQVRA